MKLSELEIKIRIESDDHFKRLLDLCTVLYGPPKSHVLQRDEYYDSSDNQLRNQDLVLRIRTIGNERMIALKSPRVQLPSGMSKRIELEFSSTDGSKVEEQLKQQGLKAYQIQEKERWTFVHDDSEILLDRLPFIGSFVEIEGPDEKTIQEIVKSLSLTSHEVVLKNYGELMRSKFKELNLSMDNFQATFAFDKMLKIDRITR